MSEYDGLPEIRFYRVLDRIATALEAIADEMRREEIRRDADEDLDDGPTIPPTL